MLHCPQMCVWEFRYFLIAFVLSAFFSNRFQRPIPDLVEALRPIDDIIDNSFISVIKKKVTWYLKMKGDFSLSLSDLVEWKFPSSQKHARLEYQNSLKATEIIRSGIVSQENTSTLDRQDENAVHNVIIKERDELNKLCLDIHRERTSKEKLRGTILLRWRVDYRGSPLERGRDCSQQKRIIRCLGHPVSHLIDQVASGVQIEPPLEPLTGKMLPSGSITTDEARLKIAAKGLWQTHEMAYFDVKVFNPYARSYTK